MKARISIYVLLAFAALLEQGFCLPGSPMALGAGSRRGRIRVGRREDARGPDRTTRLRGGGHDASLLTKALFVEAGIGISSRLSLHVGPILLSLQESRPGHLHSFLQECWCRETQHSADSGKRRVIAVRPFY
jgi:hypothetical protein